MQYSHKVLTKKKVPERTGEDTVFMIQRTMLELQQDIGILKDQLNGVFNQNRTHM